MGEVFQLRVGLLAIRDVIESPRHPPYAPIRLGHRGRSEPDVNHEAILVPAPGLDVAYRLSVDGAIEELVRMRDRSRGQKFIAAPEHLLSGIAEDLFGGPIPQRDATFGVRAHDRNR